MVASQNGISSVGTVNDALPFVWVSPTQVHIADIAVRCKTTIRARAWHIVVGTNR